MRLLRGRSRRASRLADIFDVGVADLAAGAVDLGEPTVTRLSFASGREGVRQKVAYMRGLVDEDRNNPHVRALAARILRASGIAPNDPERRARALFEWVRSHFTYVHEPIETFTRPRRLLLDERFHFGDCDDFTLALCALLEAAGFETCIEALGWDGRFRHVFLRVRIGSRWVAVEGTLPKPFGFDPAARAAQRHGRGEYVELPQGHSLAGLFAA